MVAVAIEQPGGKPVAVTGGRDGTVALGGSARTAWSGPVTGSRATTWVAAVGVGQPGRQPAAVTGGDDGTVALWRIGEDGLAEPGHRHTPLSGRTPS